MKTKRAYKLFRIDKSGNLHPLYVFANKVIPLGTWLPAESGELLPNGKVKAKLGNGLAFRPGWHMCDIPNSPWIGTKQPDGTLARREDAVWVEVEYSADVNYQEEARDNGWEAGRWANVRACLKYIPVDGYYRYKTNSKGEVMIIAGAIKVLRILSDAEVEDICKANGVVPQAKVAYQDRNYEDIARQTKTA